MDTVYALDPDDLEPLAEALARIVGTQLDQQVMVFPADDRIVGTLDVAHLDEGDGPRFAVYVEYEDGRPFSERGFDLPPGSVIDDEQATEATVTFGPLTADEVADVLLDWSRRLFGEHSLAWRTTLDDADDDD